MLNRVKGTIMSAVAGLIFFRCRNCVSFSPEKTANKSPGSTISPSQMKLFRSRLEKIPGRSRLNPKTQPVYSTMDIKKALFTFFAFIPSALPFRSLYPAYAVFLDGNGPLLIQPSRRALELVFAHSKRTPDQLRV